MERSKFDVIVSNTMGRTADLLIRKGNEYAADADRLANFKRNAAKNGQTVLEVWQTYWGKHVDSINSYIRRVKEKATYLALQQVVVDLEVLKEELPLPGARSDSDKAKMRAVIDPTRFIEHVNAALPEAIRQVDLELSEGIEGRFDDNINYSFLGIALIQELKG